MNGLKRIADIVAGESENKRTDQSAADTWKIRKTEYLKNLQSASLDVKTVALADKLSNLRAIYMDRCYVADEIWNRFNCKEKIEHEWFYRCIVFLTKDLSYTHAWIDLEWHVNKVFGVDSNVDIFDVCDKPEPDFIENGYNFDSAFFKWNCPIHDYMSRLIEDIYPNLEVIGSVEFNGNDYLEAIINKMGGFKMSKNYSSKVRLHPFVGTEYGEGKYRIMILGDSHYELIPEEDNTGIRTAKTMERFLAEPKKQRYRLFRYSLNILCGNDDENNINKFAFYNYVQTVMPTQDNRPTKELWESAQEPFREVVNVLDPDFILVIGKTVYKYMPYNDTNDKTKEIEVDGVKMWIYTYSTETKTIDVCAVYHTSYWNRIGLNAEKIRDALFKTEYSKYLK